MTVASETTSNAQLADAIALLDGALPGSGVRTTTCAIPAGPALIAIAVGDVAVKKLRELLTPGTQVEFPKLEYVSFYAKKGRGTRLSYRISYRVKGYARRTDRLGPDGRRAYKFAKYVSDILASVFARTLKAEEAYRLLYIDRSPIESHVVAYDRALKTKGVSEQYRKTTIFHVRESLKLANVDRTDQLTGRIVAPLLEALRKREAGPGKDRTIVEQTINYWLKDLRKFTHWMTKQGKFTIDPLQHSEGVQVKGEEGRRRDVLVEELTAIVLVARADLRTHHRMMPGPDRAMLYLVAFCTGLRRKELHAADVSWLHLAGDEPKIVLPDKFAKALKRGEQPLPTWLAEELKLWIGDRTGELFHLMPRDIIKWFEKDRDDARRKFLEQDGLSKDEIALREASPFLLQKTSDGVLVFHSLRHGYASSLLASNADPKLVQALTRHSTIELLFNRYGHARTNLKAAAIETAFPRFLPGTDQPDPPAQPKERKSS